MSIIGIDVLTADVELLLAELEQLRHVDYAENTKYYREDGRYCQVNVYTDLTDDQVKDWLDDHSMAEYSGNPYEV
jgi:hypothetical protein